MNTTTRPIPQAVDTERALLGCALHDARIIRQHADVLTSEDFATVAHEALWSHLTSEIRAGRSPNITTVAEWMLDGGPERMERLGGIDYVTSLPEQSITANILQTGDLVDVLRDRSRRRQAIALAKRLEEAAYAGADTEGMLTEARGDLDALSSRGTAETAADIGMDAVMDAVLDHVEEQDQAIMDGRQPGLPWGIQELDGVDRLLREELLCIAGRPSMGKSQLMLQVCEAIAAHAQEHIPDGVVYIASLEMNRKELGARWIQAMTGIAYRDILKGKRVNGRRVTFTRDEHEQIEAAATRLRTLPIVINETPARSMASLRRSVLHLNRQRDVVCVALDFMQLATVEGSAAAMRDDLRLGQIAYGMKNLAKEVNALGIAAVQLNRKVEETSTKRPQMSHIDGSGKIEQAANIIAYVLRPALYSPETEDPRRAEVGFLKNRNGETGARVEIGFKRGIFHSLSDGQTQRRPADDYGYSDAGGTW